HQRMESRLPVHCDAILAQNGQRVFGLDAKQPVFHGYCPPSCRLDKTNCWLLPDRTRRMASSAADKRSSAFRSVARSPAGSGGGSEFCACWESETFSRSFIAFPFFYRSRSAQHSTPQARLKVLPGFRCSRSASRRHSV